MARFRKIDLEIHDSYGYDCEFFKVRSIQLKIEPTKACFGNYIDLTPDFKNSKLILNTRNYKYYCLQLSIAALLHFAIDKATRDSKYVNDLIVPRQQHVGDFAYIIGKKEIV